MRTLFFIDSLPEADLITVSGDEANHALKVLRLGVGDEITLSDGNGKWAHCRINSTTKRDFLAGVLESGEEEVNKPKLKVVQAIPKSDRWREMVELLVESGVAEILPWNSARGIAKSQSDTKSKWEVAAFAAAKQSRRNFIPKISEPINLNNFIKDLPENKKEQIIFVMHESADAKLSTVFKNIFDSVRLEDVSEILIVIGPEGGITDQELSDLKVAGGHVVKLGRPVYRSAHAASAALAAISALIGRW